MRAPPEPGPLAAPTHDPLVLVGDAARLHDQLTSKRGQYGTPGNDSPSFRRKSAYMDGTPGNDSSFRRKSALKIEGALKTGGG